ncbi:MAG: putative toxin-antitoxin system toxin component, PIN family [Lachnospiraceae bacterium]|nr:putative toxin-antitoxin system toxin component, PIN family [Lachnospiraceae bacterium]
MRIMLDTNVLISAFVFGGPTKELLLKLLSKDYELYVSDYVDREFREKLELKWTEKGKKVYNLYRQLSFCFCESTTEQSGELRDVKDIPVLSDALYHRADIILSGDKDFLEAGLTHPMVYSPSMMREYMEYREKGNSGLLPEDFGDG